MRKIALIGFLFLLALAGLCLYFWKDTSAFTKMLGGKKIREGVIEYDITYPKLDTSSLMASGMPNKIYLRFKDNNISNEMSAMMGLISITYISNLESRAVEQRLTLINKKYASEITSGDLQKLNDSYISSVKESENGREIAGYACKEALVKLTNGEQMKIYYTRDIGIDNPNWSNPYNKINGVLMDFQVERYGVAMHLKAKSVLAQKIDDAVFSIPADSTEYKKIRFSELEKILQEMNPVSN